MQNLKRHHPGRRLAAVIAGVGLSGAGAVAAPFLYAPGDLVLAFRQAGNASDLVVNLGKASVYSTIAPGTTLTLTNLTSARLAAAFPTLDGVSWSVAGANRPPGLTNFPLQTLWVTAPRFAPDQASVPWLRKGQFVQGTAGGQIDAVGNNAAASSSSQPAGPNNAVDAVVISVSTDFAVSPLIGEAGDYSGTFQGRVETVIPDAFETTPGAVSVADLYELVPGTTAAGTLNSPGRYLGSFRLGTDGTLVFRAGAPELGKPVISRVTRAGETTTVHVGTTAGATYQLLYTSLEGIVNPLSSWSRGPSVLGTGSEISLQDTTAAVGRVYAVEARP